MRLQQVIHLLVVDLVVSNPQRVDALQIVDGSLCTVHWETGKKNITVLPVLARPLLRYCKITRLIVRDSRERETVNRRRGGAPTPAGSGELGVLQTHKRTSVWTILKVDILQGKNKNRHFIEPFVLVPLSAC